MAVKIVIWQSRLWDEGWMCKSFRKYAAATVTNKLGWAHLLYSHLGKSSVSRDLLLSKLWHVNTGKQKVMWTDPSLSLWQLELEFGLACHFFVYKLWQGQQILIGAALTALAPAVTLQRCHVQIEVKIGVKSISDLVFTHHFNSNWGRNWEVM